MKYTMKYKKKIILVRPLVFSSTRMYYGAPLALLAICRLLAVENKYDIKIFDPTVNKNYIKSIVKESKNAICVGISALTGYSIFDGLKIARAVKKKYPHLPIIWGGWHPSILPNETIKDPLVDIVVVGQGERTFTELVHALEKKQSLKNIKGLIYKTKTGKIITTAHRPLESLDNFPPIPYHLIDAERFVVPQEYGKRSLLYYSSYGCPHRCLFCVEQIVNHQKWIGLSPERAAEEIHALKNKYNLDSIQIIDSNFFIGEDRARRFSQRLIDLNTNIKWGNVNGRTRQMSLYSDQTWKLMKQSGLACILVGAESGDNDTLKYMQKDITVSDTLRLTKICAKYDVKILSSFLVGFPRFENRVKCHQSVEKEISTTLKLIDKMFKIYPRIRMMFALYLPYPSTALFQQSQNLGLEIPQNLVDWHDYIMAAEDASKMKVRQKWITKEQARRILMISIYIFFFKDPDSFSLVTSKITNIPYKLFLYFGFRVFKLIVDIRWKYKYFGFTADFTLYNFLRKYSGLG
jgi:radical SAM superfamily enzyme YgiQ (UPF0313 family)